jgi:hypothetical protein
VTGAAWAAIVSALRAAYRTITTEEKLMMTTEHKALQAASQIAPFPYEREAATRDAMVRHYAAQGLAAYADFADALTSLGPKPVAGSRPDLGYLIGVATASTAAAIALDNPGPDAPDRVWGLTPEAGAFNGEWMEWLITRVDELGVNPADIDHHLDPSHFSSDSVSVTR